jgi:hypothetical protein
VPVASYYLDRREQRKAIFKPYDRKAVRRDLHDARQVSIKLSAANRRYRRRRPHDA